MAELPADDDPDAIEPLLAALGGKYAARILAAADRPRSARELSDELDVPIATCYRRIEELEAANLLTCHGRESSNRGRRTRVYRRTISEVTLGLEGDVPVLDVDDRDSIAGSSRTGSLRDA
ncbi:hypothetical protein L593_00270 [Salinarchaeum sp. Harcht-Bsk1]|uniref:ArsR/SmtB family transcription factor n=1 Tax=Salinarchaeum sp. Harcht-Bsk1 TaxID=1333523 RepID=UPI000342283B|nr:helix-turn-helix domain-containing protein [Salinarchaeum sp. Harcht-Bsk1]AGN00009.1 hypothetical protein L593_00270 [Salinarchaeum sp. Harcht-Bsk1]